MSWRPIASTCRNPAVVTSAARAPLVSRIMLVATVVPCRTRSSAEASRRASSSARRMPAMKASEGSRGTLGVLARQIRPLAGSCSATSGKGPPMWTATASDGSGERIDVLVPVEGLHGRARGAKGCRGGFVHGLPGDRDTVGAACGLEADEAAEHVLEHRCGRTVEGVAVPAAAAGLDAQDVAAFQKVAVGERRERRLLLRPGIEHGAPDAPRHPARDPPGRIVDRVDADR